jgi:HEAT repeat protein
VLFHDTNDSRLKLALIDKLNALPGLNVACTPTEGRRAKAAADIGSFGPTARQAIPALIQASQSNDPVIRGPATLALGKIHEQPDQVLPLLIRYLDDQDIKAEAAEALGGYGPVASAAVPKLVPLLQVRDKELHHAVIIALKQIDPEAAAKAGIQ